MSADPPDRPQEASSSLRAPVWAIPILSAYFVAVAPQNSLRHLDDAAFQRVARGCDVFMLTTTAAGLLLAFTLLPSSTGHALLLGSSIWGLLALLSIGRTVSAERRRRAARSR
ncbi:hypothetical protein CDN99_15885 [Roseateles aquatilis]|uniref:Uncharacterized protein n=1 Tax=Roseateles aquatilis TaxID=431061 RepID=A0A246J8J1_9BURK|nr:hypothetical protein CDN99_15885 [Roseateles aquatilis]